MPATPSRNLRIPDAEYELWRQAAADLGMTLTTWVRVQCNTALLSDSADQRSAPPGQPESSRDVIEPIATVDPADFIDVDCKHPKGARIKKGPVNGCGACGATQRANGTWPT